MAELELVGIHADGEHIVMVDEDGQRHRLAIDDALRAAVRRDRPQLEQLRATTLRPRDIQTMIRAGASAVDIAEQAGVDVEQVRRYEGPALAERGHVASRAQTLAIGREPGSPTLGDLVLDRLAARGGSDITWDARRHGNEPWQVLVRFVAGDRAREAIWQVDLTARTVTAVDDESRWLSETDLAASDSPRRHLSAVRAARLYDVEADADLAPSIAAVDEIIRDTRPPEREPGTASAPSGGSAAAPPGPAEATGPGDPGEETDTESILEGLSAARGVRQRVEVDDEALIADNEPHTPMLWDDPPPAHPPVSRPDQARDTTVLRPAREEPAERAQPDEPDGAEPAGASEPPSRSARAKNRRKGVPSWDEIVFGARSD